GPNWAMNHRPGALDIARFRTSNITNLFFSEPAQVSAVTFQPGASAYTLDVESNTFDIIGTGMTNNSGILQNFSVGGGGAGGSIAFKNNASAGNLTTYTVHGSQPGDRVQVHGLQTVDLFDNSNASGATFIAYAGIDGGDPGMI